MCWIASVIRVIENLFSMPATLPATSRNPLV